MAPDCSLIRIVPRSDEVTRRKALGYIPRLPHPARRPALLARSASPDDSPRVHSDGRAADTRVVETARQRAGGGAFGSQLSHVVRTSLFFPVSSHTHTVLLCNIQAAGFSPLQNREAPRRSWNPSCLF